jgi:hypothetical protein
MSDPRPATTGILITTIGDTNRQGLANVLLQQSSHRRITNLH